MMFLIVSFLLALSCTMSAIIGDGVHVEVERMKTREDFVEMGKWRNKDIEHEVVIGIKHTNLDRLSELVLQKSTPGHPSYQKWMTYIEVGDLTTNMEGFLAVKLWLEQHEMLITFTSKRFEFMKVTGPLSKWEALLHTEFYEYRHISVGDSPQSQQHHHRLESETPRDGVSVPRTRAYSVPTTLQPHIHSLFHVCHLPPDIKAYGRYAYAGPDAGETETATARKIDMSRRATASSDSSVPFLRALYNISVSPEITSGATNSQSVFQTSGQGFNATDLSIFQDLYDLVPQQPVVVDDTGRVANIHCSNEEGNCYEGNLDLQYMMGVAQNISTTFWYVGGPTQDLFVDYILAIADSENPPAVNSISWGTHEQAMHPTTMDSFNVATMQLAAMGISVLVATGDDGVSNFRCSCTLDSSSYFSLWPEERESWEGSGYFPSFPASSPYVTAVGGTMGPNTGDTEVACASTGGGVITTGGGFSTYYPTPDWQTEALEGYFARTAGTPPASGYNPNGRGFPDVSLISTRYPTVMGGEAVLLYGTSASSPVLGGFLSLINAKREANGLPTVGWINPTLYHHGIRAEADNAESSLFNDIVDGGNHCCSGSSSGATCCTAGFDSATGWDPVTGWGSIDYWALETLLGTAAGADGMPTLSPTPAAGATPSPTASPTSITDQAGATQVYFVSLYGREEAACAGWAQGQLGQRGLFQMDGHAVGRCMQARNASGHLYNVINTVDKRNSFLYLMQTHFAEDDVNCSGVPTATERAGTGYSACVGIGADVYTTTLLVESAEPWEHPSLPDAVVQWEFVAETSCESAGAGAVSSFFWVPTGVCLGQLMYLCDRGGEVGPAGTEGYIFADYSVAVYTEEHCGGQVTSVSVDATECQTVFYQDNDDGDDAAYYYYGYGEALARTADRSVQCRLRLTVDETQGMDIVLVIALSLGAAVVLGLLGFYLLRVQGNPTLNVDNVTRAPVNRIQATVVPMKVVESVQL